MALTKVTYSMIKDAPIDVKNFGATGDGTTDDTQAIQDAINFVGDIGGGTVYFPPGHYKIKRNIGVNDHWGIKVPYSRITLIGENAYFERYNPDIYTYAFAYPLLFLGEPDSNSTSVSNITVDNIYFVGSNVRHSEPGSSLNDNKTAIVFKNTSNTAIKNCKFFEIDSSALWYQSPVEYDYTNKVYYNTTKNNISLIDNCKFYAVPHAVPGRAFLHAINTTGVDNLRIVNNYFSWCDDCVSGETTYDGPFSNELDLYTPTVSGWTLGAVKRTGRNWVFSNNNVYNSSEHAVYFGAVDVVVSGNTFYSTSPTICNSDPIKIRSRNAAISGNTISNYGGGITVTEPSFNVSVVGNTIAPNSNSYAGGAIEIDSVGLSEYITLRSDYLKNYYPMWNITISGNNIVFPKTSVSGETHIGVRIITNSSDSNYPNGQIQNISINGNNFSNYRYGVYVLHDLAKNIIIEGNAFFAKPFDTTAFSRSSVMNTESVLLTYRSGSGSTVDSFKEVRFDNNSVWGAKYLISTQDGGATAGTIDCPWGMTGNKLNYVQYIKTGDIKSFSLFNAFSKNTGYYFLDRTWNGSALDNSLGDGVNANSFNRYCVAYNDTNVIFYTDDSGGSINLG